MALRSIAPHSFGRGGSVQPEATRALVCGGGLGRFGGFLFRGNCAASWHRFSCGVLRARCWLTRQRAYPRLDRGASGFMQWNVLPSLRQCGPLPRNGLWQRLLISRRGAAAREEVLIEVPRRVTDRPSKLSVRRSRALHARFGEEALTDAEALRCFGGIQEGVGSGRFCRLAKPLPGVANWLEAIWRLGGYRVAADRDRDVSLRNFGEASNEVAVPVRTRRTLRPFVGPTRNVEKGVGSGCLCHGSSPGYADG